MARNPRPAFDEGENIEEKAFQIKTDENFIDKLINKRKENITQKVTFDVKPHLVKTLKRYQNKYGQGFKKEFIGIALELGFEYLDGLEKSKEKSKKSNTG